MTSRSLVLSLLIFPLASRACATGAEDVAAEGDDQDVTSAGEVPAVCLAIPTCERGDEERAAPCDTSEASTCYTRTECGRTIVCQRPAVTLQGTLVRSAGVGGETTGTSLKTPTETIELVLDTDDTSAFVEGRVARATGVRTKLSGVETKQRPVLRVTDLLVCPASSAVVNCQPPVAPGSTICGDDRAWVEQSCPGVSFVD